MILNCSYQFITNDHHVKDHIPERVLGIRISVVVYQQIVNTFVGAACRPGQRIFAHVGETFVVRAL